MTAPLTIRSLLAGHWRAGVFHPAAPVEHAPGAFTPEQEALLRACPGLAVTEAAAPAAESSAAEAPAKPRRKAAGPEA